MIKKFSYLLLIMILALGCANHQSKKGMLEEKLLEYKLNPAYNVVLNEAKVKLHEWMLAGLEDADFLNECKWKFDDAVLFNSRKDRALLLLLIQDNALHAELDYCYMIYAALYQGKWNIYFAGLPNMVFPRNRFGNKPISFNKLSEIARAEILNSYLYKNGEVNDAFVMGMYNEDLKAKHLKFLNKKIQVGHK